MGVITKVIVRLLPEPEAVRTLLAVFPDMDQASATVSRVESCRPGIGRIS